MKRFLSLALAGMVSLTILGCHAAIEPNDSVAPGTDVHTKKTTTVNNDGTTSTKTETSKTQTTY